MVTPKAIHHLYADVPSSGVNALVQCVYFPKDRKKNWQANKASYSIIQCFREICGSFVKHRVKTRPFTKEIIVISHVCC